MSFETENKVKIRIKLRSGEEFEAEGSPDFIEKQRADFLELIGKEGGKGFTKSKQMRPLTAVPQPPLFTPTEVTEGPQFAGTLPQTPTTLRRHQQALATPRPTQAFSTSEPDYLSDSTLNGGHSATASPHQRLWEELCKTEDDMVILRRKSRLLAPETAALLLIAGAKELLEAENGFSALNLSKSLAKSGYGANRLDRVLAGEIKRGSIKSYGSKRSRSYSLTDEGFARAFVLAGKVIEDWR